MDSEFGTPPSRAPSHGGDFEGIGNLTTGPGWVLVAFLCTGGVIWGVALHPPPPPPQRGSASAECGQLGRAMPMTPVLPDAGPGTTLTGVEGLVLRCHPKKRCNLTAPVRRASVPPTTCAP